MRLASKQELNLLLSKYRQGDLNDAYNLARKLSQKYAGDVVLLNILCVVATRLKHFDVAVKSGENALQLRQDYEDARFNLANAYVQLRAYRKAESVLLDGLSQISDPLRIYQKLVDVVGLAGDGAKIIKYVDQMFALGLETPEYVVLKAQALQGLGRFEDALQWIDQNMEKDLRSQHILITKANLLSELGKIADAKKFYLESESFGESSLLLFDSANFYLEQGNFDEAKRRYKRALVKEPRAAHAWVNLSKIPMESEEIKEMLAQIELRLESALFGSNEYAHLQFARANLLHRERRYAEAFFAFQAGNDARAQKNRFDFPNEEKFFDQIRSAYLALSESSLCLASKCWLRPIFIIGLPRSGTTLLEQIFGAHSKVESLGEIEILKSELYAWLARYHQNPLSGLVTLEGLAESYLEILSKRVGEAKFFVDKMPLNYLWAGFIAKMMPHAKFIHIYKKPLSACWSLYKQEFKGYASSYDLEALSGYYSLYRQHMAFWRRQMSADQLIEIQYEDFVSDTERMASSLLKFCELDEEEEVLRFSGSAKPVKTLSATQLREGVTDKFKNEVDNYRPFLSDLTRYLEAQGIAID